MIMWFQFVFPRGEVTTNRDSQSICKEHFSSYIPDDDTVFTAIGWGVTTTEFDDRPSATQQMVELPFINTEDCIDKFENVASIDLSNQITAELHVCAGGNKDDEKDTCKESYTDHLESQAQWHVSGGQWWSTALQSG